MTVLVVEDDADVRDLVVLSLNHAGYDVITRDDGVAGLAAALETQPDVVILDWVMPRLSGVEVCRALRADPRGAGVGVLLLTSRVQASDIDEGFAVGTDDYMVKPFRSRELTSRVDTLIANRRRAAAAARRTPVTS